MDDAAEAYRISTENGGVGVRPPVTLADAGSGQRQVLAEVKLYGDCVLRFVSGAYEVGGRVGEWAGVGGWVRLAGCLAGWRAAAELLGALHGSGISIAGPTQP